jgi:hypothetical protein
MLMHAKTNSSLKIKTNSTTNCKTNSLKTNDNDKTGLPFLDRNITGIYGCNLDKLIKVCRN